MEDIKERSTAPGNLRDMLRAPEGSRTLLYTAMALLSCAVLPLSDNPTVATLYMLLCAVFYYMTVHSVRGLIVYAAPVFLLYMLGSLVPAMGSPLILPAAFLCFVTGCSSGAFLLMHQTGWRQNLTLLWIPAVAYVTVAFVTGDPLRGALVLLPAVPAVLCALCALRLVPRTTATVALAAALALLLGVAGLITLAATGGLSADLAGRLGDLLRGGIVDLFAQMRTVYAEAGVLLGLSDADVSNMAILLVNLVPGLFLAICTVTAFLLWRTLLQLLLANGSLPRLPLRLTGLTVSRFAAVIFLTAYLLSIFANSGSTTLFGTVCENLSLVLEPCLALVGFTSLLTGAHRSCLSTVLGFGLIMFLFYSPFTALSLAAAVGAVRILTAKGRANTDTPTDNDN